MKELNQRIIVLFIKMSMCIGFGVGSDRVYCGVLYLCSHP